MTQKLKIPEQILQQHDDALKDLWAEVETYVTDVREELKVYWEREQNNVNKNLSNTLHELDGLKEKYSALLGDYNQLDQANQLLEKSIEQRSSDLRASEQVKIELNNKNNQLLEEIKQIILEVGRLREQNVTLQKQVEKDHILVQEEQEHVVLLAQEIKIHQNNIKHSEQENQHLQEELAKVNNQLRLEARKATIAETLSTEIQIQKEQCNHDIIQLKSSLKSSEESIHVANASLADANKRVSNLKTQAEMQANFNQKNMHQLESELQASKTELSELRQRVIKAESASERERKAMERLENKLLTVKR